MTSEALRIRETVLRNAEEEARRMIEDAKKRAEEIVRKAEEEYNLKLTKEKERLLLKIKEEENLRYISEVLRVNKELTNIKNKILKEVINEVKKKLMNLNQEERRESLKVLLKEVVDSGILSGRKFIVKVVKRDLELVKKVIKELGIEGLVSNVEVIDSGYIGGVLVETIEGDIAINNTYIARLERLKPEIIKVLNKEIFR